MAANEPGQPSLTAASWSRDLTAPSSALAIGAHPDDVEFGAGATLAKWAAQGCQVHHVVCTDGAKGTWDPRADVAALVATRRVEQRAAARALAGPTAGEVRFLGYVDGELEAGRAAQGALARVIRELQPEVILGHDPWKRYRLHPDHRHAGLLTCDAVVAARDPHFFVGHRLNPHRPQALLLWEAEEPNHVEDVGEFVAAKLAALQAHSSQFETTMGTTSAAGLEPFRRRIADRLAALGEPHGMAAAEVFRLITDL
jgi:LmbE family N-acetylglucosaminyl deacetylase